MQNGLKVVSREKTELEDHGELLLALSAQKFTELSHSILLIEIP